MDIVERGAWPLPHEYLFQQVIGCVGNSNGKKSCQEYRQGLLFFFHEEEQDERQKVKERMGCDKWHEQVKKRIL
jgi:hypothetical protein